MALLCIERLWWSGTAFLNYGGACGELCSTQSTSQQALERAKRKPAPYALLGVWLFAKAQPELVTGFSIGLVCFAPCNARADRNQPKQGDT